MDLDWLVLVVAIVLAVAWLLAPYLAWREAAGRPLEAQIARTSFQCAPGELVPPAWRAPELTLSVVVPAFNEEFRLPQMLDETLTYLEARSAANPLAFSYEVIVVDDGSTDGTFAAAVGSQHRLRSPLHGELRVVKLVANRGKGFAVRVGMLAARGQLLLMADADGSTSIRDVERLEQALGRQDQDGGAQMAFGSRCHLKAELAAGRSLAENALAACFGLALSALAGWPPLRDTQCGFKLFRAHAGKHLFASLHLHRWAFDLELALLARLLGRRAAEVPVAWVAMPGSKFRPAAAALPLLRDAALMQVLYTLGVWNPLLTA